MIKRYLCTCLATLSALALPICNAADNEASKTPVDVSKLPLPSDRKDVTYAADTRPLFEKSCVRCHGPQKPKGKLRLDSLEGVLKGGEDGKVVLPGNSAGSVLIHNVAHIGDPDDYMPPPKNKAGIPPLTREQISLLRAWIDQGAK